MQQLKKEEKREASRRSEKTKRQLGFIILEKSKQNLLISHHELWPWRLWTHHESRKHRNDVKNETLPLGFNSATLWGFMTRHEKTRVFPPHMTYHEALSKFFFLGSHNLNEKSYFILWKKQWPRLTTCITLIDWNRNPKV